jgi:signal transduction histidine kinase
MVARIGGGDLATPIAPALQDSAGPLGRELETMRRRLQQTVKELAVEKSRYQGIFQSISDGVFTTDLGGAVNTMNPAAAAVLQAPGGATPAVALPAAWAGAGTSKERLRRADGAVTDYEITAAPIRDEEGHQVGAVHVMRDISAQEQLRRLQRGFLLRVAHELRTPLSALSVSAEILKDDVAEMPDQTRNGMLETMHRGAVRLQHLVSNLLDLGNIEAGRFLVRTHPTALDTLVREAVDLCEHLNSARSQPVAVVLPEACPKVEADGRRVVQVLVNLLTNAAKHAGEGPVTVAVRTLGTQAEVAVTDPGPGMTPEEATRVFDHYHQANRPHAHDGQGFGVGLAIARGIVEAHGGQMGLATEPGGTTTFWFTLPVARCHPEAAAAETHHSGRRAGPLPAAGR